MYMMLYGYVMMTSPYLTIECLCLNVLGFAFSSGRQIIWQNL